MVVFGCHSDAALCLLQLTTLIRSPFSALVQVSLGAKVKPGESDGMKLLLLLVVDTPGSCSAADGLTTARLRNTKPGLSLTICLRRFLLSTIFVWLVYSLAFSAEGMVAQIRVVRPPLHRCGTV